MSMTEDTKDNVNDTFLSRVSSRGHGGSTVTTKALMACNLGNTTMLLAMPLKDFFLQSVVSNAKSTLKDEEVAQRNLNPSHSKKLAVFLLKGLIQQTQGIRVACGKERSKELDSVLEIIGYQSYTAIQPIVCNIRNIDADLSELKVKEMITSEGDFACVNISLSSKTLLHVIDGQHRREAMQQVLSFLHETQTSRRVKKTSLVAPYQPEDIVTFADAMFEVSEVANNKPTVQIECHLGLNIDSERQVFHDLNNLGKNIEQSLVTSYDTSSPVSSLVRELKEKDFCSVINRISLANAIMITSKLLTNRANSHGIAKSKVEDRKQLAYDFWSTISKVLKESKTETNMLNSLGVLKALATLMFKYSFSKSKDVRIKEKLITLIETYDFDLATNPVFSIQVLSNDEIKNAGLADIKNRLDEHFHFFNDYTKKDIETKEIMKNQKSHLVKTYSCIFTEILEN
jgi:hypothetical protein